MLAVRERLVCRRLVCISEKMTVFHVALALIVAQAHIATATTTATATQTVTVYLTAPDPAGLDRLARSAAGTVTGSPQDRAARLRAFLPSRATHDTVANKLDELGLRVIKSTTWSVTASGEAGHLRQLFGSARRSRPTLRYAQSLPTVPPSLYGLVSVAVGGDEIRPALRPLGTPAATTVPAPARTAAAIPASSGYTGADLRTAYGAPDGHRGDGGPEPTVASLQLSGWDSADLRAYAAAAGIPDPVMNGRYTAVSVGREPGYDPARDGDGDSEVALGQEALLAVAPTARQRVYFGPNTDQGFLDILDRVRADAADPAANLVAFNVSWGLCEPHNSAAFVSTAETLLAAIAAAGVTTFAASGDSGSDDCGNGTATASYPASSPSAIAVGGTSMLHPASTTVSETAWAGSGGGCSTLFARPGWQPATSCASRALPDLAMDADPTTGFAVYDRRYWESHGGTVTPGWLRFGGTSLAAPAAAGMLAAVWASGGQRSGGYGDIHDQLYQAPAAAFRDVITGGNGAHSATAGFDLVTGRGAPLWNKLAAALVSRPLGLAQAQAQAGYTIVAGVGVDHAVWAKRSDQARPMSLGGQATSVPTVIQAAGRVTYIVGGTDGNLWMRGDTDHAWSPLGLPGTHCYGQAAIVVGSTLHLGCRGSDRALYVTAVPIDTTGQPARVTWWTNYGGRTDAAPAVAVVDGAVTWFITRASDSAPPAANLYRRTATSFWKALGVRCDGAPGAGGNDTYADTYPDAYGSHGDQGYPPGPNGAGRAFVGCRLASGTLAYAAVPFIRFIDAGGRTVGPPAFVRAGNGTVDAFTAGTDRALHSRRLTTSAPLDVGWTDLGGTYLLGVGVARVSQEP